MVTTEGVAEVQMTVLVMLAVLESL
jgi:hypothetical protein